MERIKLVFNIFIIMGVPWLLEIISFGISHMQLEGQKLIELGLDIPNLMAVSCSMKYSQQVYMKYDVFCRVF